MKIYNVIFIIIAMLGFHSCNQTGTISEDVSKVATDGGIILSKEKITGAEITFGKIEKKTLSFDVSARGQIIIPPEDKASVSVMMGGIIQSLHVIYGQAIKKGQLLATYSHPDFIRIQQDYLEALTRYEFLEKEYNRQKILVEKNIKSEKEFQTTEADFQNSKTVFLSAKSTLDLLNIDKGNLANGNINSMVNIYSPIGGTVEKINATIGMFATIGDPLFEIVNLSNLMIQLKVFEKDILRIKKGQRITFGLSGSENDGNEAYVSSIGSTVDPDARVITVLAKIETKGLSLYPGMFVSSKIHTSEDLLDALPESAIIVDADDKTYGFYTLNELDDEEMIFYSFPVKTGFSEDGFIHVQLEKSIPSKAKIALTGVYYLKSEMLKSMDE
ncbi:MAG: efflux RND transporter periplasmic adaptor subunit [Bacteroidales bacterium]